MKHLHVAFVALSVCLPVVAAEPAKTIAAANAGVADAQNAEETLSTQYEGKTYTFPNKEGLAKWKAERAASLYQQIGGKAAIDAAVDRFYVKVLADDRIKGFFADVDMVRQHTKQKAFLSAALGGPVPYTGRDMQKAHAKVPGLNDSHFNAVAENLQATLVELKVPKDLIDKVMAVAESTRPAVLNKGK